jgi:hypothetical protein
MCKDFNQFLKIIPIILLSYFYLFKLENNLSDQFLKRLYKFKYRPVLLILLIYQI